jgi:Ca-activated chloride channel homolog
MVNFGLYDNGKKVPLKKVAIESTVMGSVASITQVQVYSNNTSKVMETVYHFPKTMDSVFGGLTVEFNDKTVVAEIKEKNQAKIDFEEAKTKGKQRF